MTKKTKPTIRTVLAGVTFAGVLTLPLGGVAGATTGSGERAPTSTVEKPAPKVTEAPKPKVTTEKAPTVGGMKAGCTEQIARRLKDLDRLAARVAERAEMITDAHEAAIGALVTEAKAGLTALKTEVGAATTIDALKPLCRRVVTDFRVYALRIPQVNLVLAADKIAQKEATFDALRDKLAAAIAGSPSADDEKLAALLEEFDAHVAAMLAAVDGLADKVLALTPAQYNADPKVLKPYVEKMKVARTEAKRAAKTARTILELLSGEGEHDDSAEPTTNT